MRVFPFKCVNNKNSQKINFQHIYYKKFITKKVYHYKELITKTRAKEKTLSEIYKKQGKKPNAKEKNLNEIYSKQGKRQGQKKNLSNDGKKKKKT